MDGKEKHRRNELGFFGIGIISGKSELNLGVLWRSANVFGASFIYTIGKRYPRRQRGDTMNTPKSIPLFQYEDWGEFLSSRPRGAEIVGVELDDKSVKIETFVHPKKAIYLLGAEDSGIPVDIRKQCNSLIQIPGWHCLNVATSGSIVLYDRIAKANLREIIV